MELSILDEQMRMSWIGEVASFYRETTANYFQVSLIQRCPHFMGMEESVFIQKKSFQGLHSVLALTCSVETSSVPIAGLTQEVVIPSKPRLHSLRYPLSPESEVCSTENSVMAVGQRGILTRVS